MNLFLDQLNNIELYQRKEDIFTPIINSNIKQVQKIVKSNSNIIMAKDSEGKTPQLKILKLIQKLLNCY